MESMAEQKLAISCVSEGSRLLTGDHHHPDGSPLSGALSWMCLQSQALTEIPIPSYLVLQSLALLSSA